MYNRAPLCTSAAAQQAMRDGAGAFAAAAVAVMLSPSPSREFC